MNKGAMAAASVLVAAMVFIGVWFNQFSHELNRGGRGPAFQGEPYLPVDANVPGEDIPPAGRSVFDRLFADPKTHVYRVPYPFKRLVAVMNTKLAKGNFTGVFFPEGRSLQRNAAKPDYYRYPRIVSFANGTLKQPEKGPGWLIQDRLYIGYVEKTNTLEVVSYNEEAGRFEFQIVRGYFADKGQGETGLVYYADRSLCISCHQGHTPIFSVDPWPESNNNVGVLQRLKLTLLGPNMDGKGPDLKDPIISWAKPTPQNGLKEPLAFYHGLPLIKSDHINTPLDQATRRGNLYPALQKVWDEGCRAKGGSTSAADIIKCRAHFLNFALQYRLASEKPVFLESDAYRGYFRPYVDAIVDDRWPGGLYLPDNELTPRDPTLKSDQKFDTSQLGGPNINIKKELDRLIDGSEVDREDEPLNTRPPLPNPWSSQGDGVPNNSAVFETAVGIGRHFLTATDMLLIEKRLLEIASTGKGTRVNYSTECKVKTQGQTYNLTCAAPDAPAAGTKGTAIMQISFDAGAPTPAGAPATGSVSQVMFKDEGADCHLTQIEKDQDVNPELRCPEVRDVRLKGTLVQNGADSARAVFQVFVESSGLRARRDEGWAVQRIEVQLPKAGEEITAGRIELLDDFAFLTEAISKMQMQALGSPSHPLAWPVVTRRMMLQHLMTQLGVPGYEAGQDPKVSVTGYPAAITEPKVNKVLFEALPKEKEILKTFMNRCSGCHHPGAPGVPGYIRTTPQETEITLEKCAEPMAYRLRVWDMPDTANLPHGMPPENKLASVGGKAGWIASTERRALLSHLEGILKKKGISLEELMKKPPNQIYHCPD